MTGILDDCYVEFSTWLLLLIGFFKFLFCTNQIFVSSLQMSQWHFSKILSRWSQWGKTFLHHKVATGRIFLDSQRFVGLVVTPDACLMSKRYLFHLVRHTSDVTTNPTKRWESEKRAQQIILISACSTRKSFFHFRVLQAKKIWNVERKWRSHLK